MGLLMMSLQDPREEWSCTVNLLVVPVNVEDSANQVVIPVPFYPISLSTFWSQDPVELVASGSLSETLDIKLSNGRALALVVCLSCPHQKTLNYQIVEGMRTLVLCFFSRCLLICLYRVGG